MGVLIEGPYVQLNFDHTAGESFALKFGKQRSSNSLSAKGGGNGDCREVANAMREQAPTLPTVSELSTEKRNRLTFLGYQPIRRGILKHGVEGALHDLDRGISPKLCREGIRVQFLHTLIERH